MVSYTPTHCQDIIVYDNTYPVLFSEGDFIITTQHNVRGVIEVKTKVVNADGQKNSFRNAIEKFNSLAQFNKISDKREHRIFKGLFSFDYNSDIASEVKEIIELDFLADSITFLGYNLNDEDLSLRLVLFFSF